MKRGSGTLFLRLHEMHWQCQWHLQKGITEFERGLVLTGTTLDKDAVKPDSEPEGAGKIGEPSEDFGIMVPQCLPPIMALSLRLRVSSDTNRDLSVTQGRGSPLAAGAKLHVLSRDPDKSLAFLAVRVQPRWRRPQAGARDDQVDDSNSIHVMSAQARLQGT